MFATNTKRKRGAEGESYLSQEKADKVGRGEKTQLREPRKKFRWN